MNGGEKMISYETLRSFESRLEQLEAIMQQLIEELKAAKVIKEGKK